MHVRIIHSLHSGNGLVHYNFPTCAFLHKIVNFFFLSFFFQSEPPQSCHLVITVIFCADMSALVIAEKLPTVLLNRGSVSHEWKTVFDVITDLSLFFGFNLHSCVSVLFRTVSGKHDVLASYCFAHHGCACL